MLPVPRFLWILVLSTQSFLVSAAQTQLAGVSYANQSNRLLFDLNATAPYRFFTLQNPSRLVVDFTNTRLTQNLTLPAVSQSLLVNVRSAVRNNTDLRVVFELAADVDAQSAMQANKLQVDLSPKSKPMPKLVRAIAPVSEPVPNKKTKIDVQPVALQTEPSQSKASKAKGRDIVVAIDAGHGGKDVGAQGSNGTQEKDVVFAIAKRLQAMVNSQPGMKAVMIRNGDYFVKLNERVRLARAAKADLFVSIHADAFSDASAHGASVYTLANKGASSAGARFLADSENASDNVGGVSLDDKEQTLASVLMDLSQSAAKEASQNVGNKVLRSVKSVGHLHRSAVQKAGFVVLKSADIPSILVETAFISNPDEERNLNSSGYQNKMASAVFGGIVAHFKQYAPTNTLFAQLTKQGKVNNRMLAVREPEQDTPVPTSVTVSNKPLSKVALLASGDEDAAAPTLPAATATKAVEISKNQHKIHPGETLSGIAQQYGISMRELRLANGMSDGNVRVGQVLQIPRDS